ncbi:MAG: corrinoid protein [Bacteroidetes bacterium]|nr:corrinoid protein [Bacteroidota bacterium]
MDILQQISDQIDLGDDEKVHELTTTAIEQKIPVKKILDEGLLQGMNIVGQKFKEHKLFLPEVLMAAKAMNAGMELIKPLLLSDSIPMKAKVVIGTVRGDLHDIGKNLVGVMLKGAGFEIIDLGNDVTPEKFVETAKTEGAEFIGMSALLTTTMPVMKEVVDQIRKENLEEKIQTLIGGAAVSRSYAEEIGATAYCYDGSNAVEYLNSIV